MFKKLQQEILNCNKCEIRSKCIGPVPGYGPLNTDIMIIAQNPGKDEDKFGKPLIGASGKLLTKILDKAELNRDDIYLTNVGKCLTPNNRLPTPEEVQNCKHFLWKEIKLIRPKIIILLGRLAIDLLLKPHKSVRMRDLVGKSFNVEYCDAVILGVYHPSFLLQRGARFLEQSIEIFKNVKEMLDEK